LYIIGLLHRTMVLDRVSFYVLDMDATVSFIIVIH